MTVADTDGLLCRVVPDRCRELKLPLRENADAPRVPPKFLGEGAWHLRAFSDTSESTRRPEAIAEIATIVSRTDTLEFTLAPAGGYAAALSKP